MLTACFCPKHVESYSKNKLEKLVHLVGFIIRIYHDARSSECQIAELNPAQLDLLLNDQRSWVYRMLIKKYLKNMSRPVFGEICPACGFIVYSSELAGRIFLISVGRELLRSVSVGQCSERHSKLNSRVLIV